MLTRNDAITIVKLLAAIWLGLLFTVVLREIAGSLTLRDWQYDAAADLRLVTLQMWLPWVLMSVPLTIVIKKFLFYPDQWLSTLIRHLAFAMCFIFIHLAFNAIQFQYFVPEKPEIMQGYAAWQHMGHLLITDPLLLTDLIIYTLFAASFNITNYIQLMKQKELDTSQLEASLFKSKLHALQMQVNPHFLFNTLNSISVLVQKHDFNTAEEMIHRLSDFLRMTLEKSGQQLVPLEAELELLDNYLAIEQMRFKDRLSVEWHIDKRTLAVPVPALILQPLVENSLRHGINAIEGPGVLTVRSSWLADRILLEVIDNGAGCAPYFSPHFKEGIGLSNVRQRLKQLFVKDYLFSFDSAPGKGTAVAIEIPVPDVMHNSAEHPATLPATASVKSVPGIGEI